MSIIDFDGREHRLDGDIRLNGTEIDLIVGGALQSFDEDLSVTGSSLVRVGIIDPDRELITSGLLDVDRDDANLLGREVELIVDGVAYWLRKVAKRGDVFELTFEDRTVCKLRDIGTPIKVAARTIGDRRFLARLCAEVDAPELIWDEPEAREIAARRAIGKTTIRAREDQSARDRRREPGFADGARLTAKGAPMNAEQRMNAGRVLAESRRIGAGPRATLAAAMAGIVENVWSNSNVINDGRSVGVFQAQFGISEGINDKLVTREEALDIEYMTRCFHEDRAGGGFASNGGAMYLERTQPSMPAGDIAQAVEGSAFPDRYAEYEDEARALIEAFNGGTLPLSSGVTTTIERTVESPLTVERGESYWDAAVRIAESYTARFFVVANQPYYFRDGPLMRARPQMTLSEDTPGVHLIDWEWAPRKQLRRTDLECNVRAWQAPPGSVVVLDDDCGPAAGRWLVGNYERSRFSPTARITLIKGRRPTVPTETRSSTRTSPGSRGTGSGAVPGAGARVAGTPKEIIDTIVLPMAQACGIQRSVAENDAGNASHGPTVSGTRSDHQGPPGTAWAADMSNGSAPTPEMDRLAADLCARFRIPPLDLTVFSTDANAHSVTWGGYRFQIIYRSGVGGNHTNHVHFGVKVA